MMMNRQHKHNVFTKGYLKQLDRTLYALEMTEEENLLMRFGSHDESTFSRGTDIKTLLHHSSNKDMDPIVEYLNSLFNFQTAFARNNKPMFSTVTGRVENSANWLVGSSGISCISRDAQLEFNETSSRNRIVPHAGASYYLTRMPGEMGTFLALTGTKYTGSEAQGVLGLADHIFEWDKKSQSK
jgi:enoyl-CoA hydratase/carnithine racemase